MLKLVLLFVLVTVSWNVEGKAVRKRSKPTKYLRSSYSLVSQSNAQGIANGQKAAENIYWHRSSTDGDNDHQPYVSDSKFDNYPKSNLNHVSDINYDIENYANLDAMIDSEFASQDMQQDKSNSKEYDDALESDQVFLLHGTFEKSKYIDHKAKSNLPENYLKVHSKVKKQIEIPFISTIQPEMNANPNQRSFQSIARTTQTASQQPETEPSEKLTSDDNDFGLVPSELKHDWNESSELNQGNIPTENKSNALTLLESEDLKLKGMRIPVTENNFPSSLQQNKHSNKDNFVPIINTEDQNLFKMGINQMFEANFDSFIFNPSADPLENFQECVSPQNESGFCRYVQHCMLPGILNSVQHFMENVCIIERRFIGVCCPEFPVQTILVKWKDHPENFNDRNDTVEVPQDCGIGTNTRIVGGNNADRKAWLWMVALLNDKKKFFCGGSLINSQYVLTAAHCTFGSSQNHIVARLGEYDFNDPRDPHDDYRVVEIKRHGQYNKRNLKNDIALLKLEKPVVFNEFVKTICFPEAANDYIGNVTTLVGWGHLNGDGGGTSDVLQMASFPVISNDECSANHRMPIPSSLICAAAVSRDKGACNGDSGGPLMLLDKNDRWKVIGIVSWGRRGCNPKFPTVYTRVTYFMDWIRKHST